MSVVVRETESEKFQSVVSLGCITTACLNINTYHNLAGCRPSLAHTWHAQARVQASAQKKHYQVPIFQRNYQTFITCSPVDYC